MRTIGLIPFAFLIACHSPNSSSMTSIELPNGHRVLLGRAATYNECKSIGLDLDSGNVAFLFSPMPGDLSGPSGICVIHSSKVIAFKVTGQAL